MTKWDNAAFHQAMRAPSSPLEKQQLTQTSQSYAEQRRFNMFALEAAKLDESTQFLASQSEQNLAELHVSIPSVAGLTVVNPAEWEQQLTCGAVVWSFDQTGAISSLRVGGKQYASKTHVLAQLQYQTYNESDFVWYHSSTANGCGATTCPCRSCEHGFGKFNSSCPIAGAIVRLSLSRSFPHTKLMCHRGSGFPVNGSSPTALANVNASCANPVNSRSLPTIQKLHVSDDQCTAVVQVAFAPELAREYGAPQVAYLRIEVGAAKDDTTRADLPVMNLSLTLWNKTSTRLPEATWFNFKTAPPAGSGTAPRWEMNKLSSWIDPMTVVDGGNQYQHGVHTGVRSGGLTVETLDAILVAPITAQPAVRETCPGTQAQPARYEGNCKDIWCTWQGTPTALPGGGTRDAGLAPLPKVVGMGYNLHNNMWSINYPVFSPYPNDLWGGTFDDSNYLFRFRLRFQYLHHSKNSLER